MQHRAPEGSSATCARPARTTGTHCHFRRWWRRHCQGSLRAPPVPLPRGPCHIIATLHCTSSCKAWQAQICCMQPQHLTRFTNNSCFYKLSLVFEERTSLQHGSLFMIHEIQFFLCRFRVCSEYKINIFFLLPFDEAFTNSFGDVELANELSFAIKSLIYYASFIFYYVFICFTKVYSYQ